MQALYGWAGADPDALPSLFGRFSCITFSQTVNRRCPTTHIKEANAVIEQVNQTEGLSLPLMESMPHAHEGSISTNATFKTHPL
eukprot:945085-Prorocentrum_lima.AAC.1